MVKGSLKPFVVAVSVALVSNLFVGAVEAKPKAKGAAASGDAAASEPAKSAPAANDPAPQVVQQWEQRLFFKNFAEEDVNARLERIEKRIFGQAIEGASEERLSRLDDLLKQKLAEEQKQKDAEARRAGTTGGGTAGGAAAAGTSAEDLRAKKEEEMERARMAIQSAREQEIATLLADGVALFRKKQGLPAQDKFEQVLRLDPTNAQAHFNLGIIEEAMGNFVEALSSYKQASANDPGNKEYEEAVTAIAKKASAQANSIGKRADLRALAEQANAAWKRGEYYSALDLYQQLDQKEPNRALVKYNIGSIYLMLKDPDSAVTAYEAAAKLEPGEQKYVKAYKELAAELKRSQKEQAKAEADATAEWKEANGVAPEPKGSRAGSGRKQQPSAPVQQQRPVQAQAPVQRPMQQPMQQQQQVPRQQGMAYQQQPQGGMMQGGGMYPNQQYMQQPMQQAMQQPNQFQGQAQYQNQFQNQNQYQNQNPYQNQYQQPSQQYMQGNGYYGSAQAPAQQLQQPMMQQQMQRPMQQQMAMQPQQQMQPQQMQPQQMQQPQIQQQMQPQQQMQRPMQQAQRPMQQQQPQQQMQQQPMQQQNYGNAGGTTGGGEVQAGNDMMMQFGFLGKSNGEGFTVVRVGNASRAATAGLVVGDDIKAVDGIQVNNKEDILNVLSNINPAKRIPFLIMRNGNLAVLNL